MADAEHHDDTVTVSLTYHGKPHSFELYRSSTINDLSEAIEDDLSIPQANQKLMAAKLGLLKYPFKDPSLPVASLADKKISLMGSTAAEVNAVNDNAANASARLARTRVSRPRATVRKTHDWRREQEESQYTFKSIRPLSYLPNPSRSLDFLKRLANDPGIKAAMRKHEFSVGLLTEMNPVEHTQADHQGVSRTLGLNRNKGEVIELRLRTDAYDGYRDYKTIRKTLCHELAHNVHSDHDRNFWDLTHQIEKEVAAADWKHGGRSVGEEEFYEGGSGDEIVDDHGGWTGGEFVLGANPSASAAPSSDSAALSTRDLLRRAAEERMKRSQKPGEGGSTGNGSA